MNEIRKLREKKKNLQLLCLISGLPIVHQTLRSYLPPHTAPGHLKEPDGVPKQLFIWLDPLQPEINPLVIKKPLTALFLNPEAMNPDLDVNKQTKQKYNYPKDPKKLTPPMATLKCSHA